MREIVARQLGGGMALHRQGQLVGRHAEPVVLDFDHLGDKQSGISQMVAAGKPWDRILVEISKCEVVCANDHRRRTARSFGWARLAAMSAGSSAAETTAS